MFLSSGHEFIPTGPMATFYTVESKYHIIYYCASQRSLISLSLFYVLATSKVIYGWVVTCDGNFIVLPH